MTPPSGSLTPTHPAAAAPPAAAVPAPADGIELLGQLEGSGYQNVPFLVRRADGQTLQLTSLLYATLACVDGRRTYAEIAQRLSAAVDREILAEDVEVLIDEKLRPLGVLQSDDGAQPAAPKADPLLGLKWRFAVSDPDTTRRITRPFSALFRPYVAVPILIAFAAASTWLLVEKGLASATHDALYQPGLLLLLFVLTMLSAGFHEFGHAAACRYGGATPGAMGGGIYLVWPAFYTDVTDSYRLGRWGRIRVDVGGLFFNAIFAVGMFAAWSATRWDALLLMIPAQLLQMARQLLPFVRFDGYHILADVTGVPDLFSHIKPTLLAMAPSRWRRPPKTALKRWARVVVTAWVLLVVPILLFSLVMMVKVMPRVAATAWDSLALQWAVLQDNAADGAMADVAVRVLSMFTIALPVASMTYMLSRVVRRTIRRTWTLTEGRPAARGLATVGGVAALLLLTWAWWPEGQYRPIERYERGTLVQAFSSEAEPTVMGAAGLAPQPIVVGGVSTLALPASGMQEVSGTSLTGPSLEGVRAQPRMGLVLTPKDGSGEKQVIVLPRGEEALPETPPAGWPFPFDPPRVARPGDNQSVAVNTTDGSTLYDVSFAVVWVTGGDGAVDQRNEAYALASCSNCTTVAVAFQVVLVLGQADVIVPQNVAVAVNYDCLVCQTYALAIQLVATLSDVPSDEAMQQLAALEAELAQLEQEAATISLDELYARLLDVEAAILQILANDTGSAPTVEVEQTEPTEDPTPVPPDTEDSGVVIDPDTTGTDAETVESDTSDDAETSTDTTADDSTGTEDVEDDTAPADSDTSTVVEEASEEPAAEPSAEPSAEATAAP